MCLYILMCCMWAIAVVAYDRAPRPVRALRTLVRLLTLATLAPILFPAWLVGKLKAGAHDGPQGRDPAGANGRAEEPGV